MEVVFVKDSGSLFSSEPPPKSFYCPTTPIRTEATPTHMSQTTPTRSYTTPPHWDIVTSKSSELSTSGSSKFNETWPSHSEGTSGPEGSLSSAGGHSSCQKMEKTEEGTLAKYVDRFRKAPPTDRTTRKKPTQPFWWKQDHMTTSKSHVTPPKTPQDHSTPDSTKCKTSSYTNPSPKVSSLAGPDPSKNDSLDIRSQELIDKSSSLLSSSDSSLPAQKYLNTRPQAKSQHGDTTPPPVVVPRLFQEGDPADDILYQWRLKRRLEMARSEAVLLGRESRQFDPPVTTGWTKHTQPSALSAHSTHISPLDCERGGSLSGPRLLGTVGQVCGCCDVRHQQALQEGFKGQLSHVAPCESSLKPTTEPPPMLDHPHSHAPPDSHSTQSPPSHPQPTQPEPVSNDVSVSDFSLDFTTEMDQIPPPNTSDQTPSPHTSHQTPPPNTSHQTPPHTSVQTPPNTSDQTPPNTRDQTPPPHTSDQTPPPNTSDQCPRDSEGRVDNESIDPVISEVVGDRLFGERKTSSPHIPTSSTAHTPTPPPSTPITSDETTSIVMSDNEGGLPWDHHMDDDLLKTIISKARLFEEQIKTIDNILSSMS